MSLDETNVISYYKTNQISFWSNDSERRVGQMSFIVFVLLFTVVCGWLDARARHSPIRGER